MMPTGTGFLFSPILLKPPSAMACIADTGDDENGLAVKGSLGQSEESWDALYRRICTMQCGLM